METTRHSISLNAQPQTQAETLADLPVIAEQAQQILGGTDVIVSAGPGGGGHVKVFNGATIKSGGAWPPPGGTLNHNETVAEDEATTPEALIDLPLENAEQIKGGSTDSPQGTGKTLTAVLLGK